VVGGRGMEFGGGWERYGTGDVTSVQKQGRFQHILACEEQRNGTKIF
jgi:hypothetical protein